MKRLISFRTLKNACGWSVGMDEECCDHPKSDGGAMCCSSDCPIWKRLKLCQPSER